MLVSLTKKVIFLIWFILTIFLIIAFSRGYRPDIKQKKILSTGIVSVTSSPKSAQVYINDKFKGVTDINLNLPPGRYKINVKKDGYFPWEKEIILKGELVINLDPLLFAVNPSLSAQTNIGIKKAIAINRTGKILLFVENGNLDKDGLYLFDINKKVFSFFPPLRLLAKKTQFGEIFEASDFSQAELDFSPDYKQVLIRWSNNAYILNLDEENSQPFDVSFSYENLLASWKEELKKQQLKVLETFGKDFFAIASDSFHLIAFSPDKTKILYQPKKNISLPSFLKTPLLVTNQTPEERNLTLDKVYVYDRKEDKNFAIFRRDKPSLFSLENPIIITWYSDSKHLVFVKDKKIIISDYDNTNKQIVYSAPFEEGFLSITDDGRLLILANLNPQANLQPDLYSVSLK